MRFVDEFRDAELASLIAPRGLVVEYSKSPAVAGPPPVRDRRRLSGAPGRIETPPHARVREELRRAEAIFPGQGTFAARFRLIAGSGETAVDFGSEPALRAFLDELGVTSPLPAAA